MLGVKCKTTKLLDNPSICKHCSIRCCSLCACGTRRYVKCQSCFDKIQEQGARIKEEKISKFTSNGLGNTPTNLFLSPKSHLCSSMKKDSARERNSSVNCPVVESDKMAPEKILPGDSIEFLNHFLRKGAPGYHEKGIVLSTQISPQWKIELHNQKYVSKEFWGRRIKSYSFQEGRSSPIPKNKLKWRCMNNFKITNGSLPEEIKTRIQSKYNLLHNRAVDGALRKRKQKLEKQLKKYDPHNSTCFLDDCPRKGVEEEEEEVWETDSNSSRFSSKVGSSSSEEEDNALRSKRLEFQERKRKFQRIVEEATTLSPQAHKKYHLEKQRREKNALK